MNYYGLDEITREALKKRIVELDHASIQFMMTPEVREAKIRLIRAQTEIRSALHWIDKTDIAEPFDPLSVYTFWQFFKLWLWRKLS